MCGGIAVRAGSKKDSVPRASLFKKQYYDTLISTIIVCISRVYSAAAARQKRGEWQLGSLASKIKIIEMQCQRVGGIAAARWLNKQLGAGL